jgi:transposase
VCGPSVGDHVGANPVDRGKPGSKLHLVCDGGGLPLTAVVTAANVNDTTMFQAVLDDVPPVRIPSGQRRCRPGKVHGDKAYDSKANRAYLRRRGIRPRIARRGVESATRLGRQRWKVERSLSWLSCWRRLGVRWDRDSGRWFAFVLVACAVVCFNRLQPAEGLTWGLTCSRLAAGTSVDCEGVQAGAGVTAHVALRRLRRTEGSVGIRYVGMI